VEGGLAIRGKPMTDTRPRPKTQPSEQTLDSVLNNQKSPVINTFSSSDHAISDDGRIMYRDRYGKEELGGWYVVVKDSNLPEDDAGNLEAVPWEPADGGSA
jgi:hypothetical protein